MAERTEIRPYESLCFKLNPDGSWTLLRSGKTGFSGAMDDTAPSFDEAVALAKKLYSVR